MIGPDLVARLVEEDVPAGDLTTEALGIGRIPGVMTFSARRDMVVAGIDVVRRMMEGLDVALNVADGDHVEAGALLLEARGSASGLHLTWKASQTLMEILGGIATATADVVAAVAAVDPAVRVATTRKTVPGARRLSQLAVKAGGGIIHRTGLSETVLVFAEHRAFLAGESLAAIAARLRKAQPEKAIWIEVGTLEEALDAAAAGFDVLQLERFSPGDVARLADHVAAWPNRPRIAPTGGIHPENAALFARAGADFVVTSWPYTARPCDVAVTLGPA
jgi:molybdenum transport protein